MLEYVGNVPPELRDSLLSDLNKESARLIQVGRVSRVEGNREGLEGSREGVEAVGREWRQ